MKLGLVAGYWKNGPPEGIEERIAVAESLGYDSVWTAESYGSDAVSPLAWWGAGTSRIKLGTGIMQMAARTPAATAMTAMTLDHLSGGRLLLGLGASGPQVVEGWHGVPYGPPLARTREYVEVVRAIVAREEPVEYRGEYYRMPLEGGTGLGKPLKSNMHPLRRDIPIYLAAQGPRNVTLAAEIADGWLPFWISPDADDLYRRSMAEGFARRKDDRQVDDFEVAAAVTVIPDPDLEAAADRVRPAIALYVGGMGSRDKNFHRDVFVRMGFEAECRAVQEHYLAGRKSDAIAAVTTEMVRAVALIGSPARIEDDLARWEESVVTTLLVQGPPSLLELMAQLTD